jgi:hypothetical protein
LPNPFNKKNTETTGPEPSRPVVNSELWCQYCFEVSTEGTYYFERKVLAWDCDECGQTNIVKNIDV